MMKNLLSRLALISAMAMPLSAYAHPESHHHYSVMTFLHHFFTQPDHLVIIGLLLAVLVYSNTPLRQWLSRRLSQHRSDKK